jgi:hypothetical protein
VAKKKIKSGEKKSKKYFITKGCDLCYYKMVPWEHCYMVIILILTDGALYPSEICHTQTQTTEVHAPQHFAKVNCIIEIN